MNGETTVGYAVLIWLIRFAVISVLVGAGVYGYSVVVLLVTIFSGIVSYRVSIKKIKPTYLTEAVWLGIVWGVLNLILDATAGAHFYSFILSSWAVWPGYFLILFAPIVHQHIHHKTRLKENPRYHP